MKIKEDWINGWMDGPEMGEQITDWKRERVDIKNGKIDSSKNFTHCGSDRDPVLFGRCASLGWNRALRRSATFHVLKGAESNLVYLYVHQLSASLSTLMYNLNYTTTVTWNSSPVNCSRHGTEQMHENNHNIS